MEGTVFLTKQDVLTIHENQLALYGGLEGLRDEPGVESAIHSPKNWAAFDQYEPDDLIPGIAAAYLFAFASNQYFIDGNKRTAAASADVFLQLNGYELTCQDEEVYHMTKLVANGHLAREGLIEWIRECISPAA